MVSMPYEARQRLARARRLVTAKNYQQAEEEIEQALALFPDEAEILALAADVERRAKKLSEAEIYLRRAEAIDPADEAVMSVGATWRSTARASTGPPRSIASSSIADPIDTTIPASCRP